MLIEADKIIIGLVSAGCFLALIPTAYRERISYIRLITIILLIVAVTNIGVGYIPITYGLQSLNTWGNFVSIVSVLSALFMMIRESKPVFARFPFYLTFLPFISLIFFGLLDVSYAIKDLLIIIFKAGALLVSFMLFGIHSYLFSISRVYLIALFLFLLHFIYSFTSLYDTYNSEIVGAIMTSVGMISFIYALIKKPFYKQIISE